MQCPRCGGQSIATISIAGVSFTGCASCYLPSTYFAAYKSEYQTTPDCPFCDGLGELNYTPDSERGYLWGPCLYCRLDEYKEWLERSNNSPMQ